MEKNKQIAYFYNSEFNADDTQVDMDGDIGVPQKGEIIEKYGELWKVEIVMVDHSFSGALPVHRVYLVRA